jgi:hypothetical protein
MCKYFLTKVKGRDGGITIDMPKSHCWNLTARKFNYNIAQKSVPRLPSSNVPIQCPCCPSQGRNKALAVWKLCLEDHFKDVHPSIDRRPYEHLWHVSDVEVHLLQQIWDTRLTKKNGQQSRKTKSARKNVLEISEAPSSRMALRSIYYPSCLT